MIRALSILILSASLSNAVTLVFSWSPVPDAVMYRLYWGPSADKMIGAMDCQTNRATFDNAQRGTIWRVTAINVLGMESEFSGPCGFPDDYHKGRRGISSLSTSRRR